MIADTAVTATGDDAIALQFLRVLHPEDVEPLKLLIWTKADAWKRSHWFDSIQQATDFAASTTDADTYFGGGLSRKDFGPHQRCKAEDIAAIPGFGGDLDVAGPAHTKPGLPKTKEDALQILNLLPKKLQPTLIVDTGHGFQPWWLFKELWVFESAEDRERAAVVSQRLHNFVAHTAERLGFTIDAVYDLARVFRLPGTMNRKVEGDHRLAHIVADAGSGRRFNPSDIEELLDKYGVPEVEVREIDDDGRIELGSLRLSPKIELAGELKERLNELLQVDSDFRFVWTRLKPMPKDNTWSGYAQSIANRLVQAGFSEQEMVDLLAWHRSEYGDPGITKPRVLAWYARTINKARAWVAKQQAGEPNVTPEKLAEARAVAGELDARLKADPGAAFTAEMIQALAVVQEHDSAEWSRTKNVLRKRQVSLRDIQKAIADHASQSESEAAAETGDEHALGDDFIRKRGSMRALLANAELMLRTSPEWQGVVGFNEFTLEIEMLRPGPWGGFNGGKWTDYEDSQTAIWLQREGCHVSDDVAAKAALVIARRNPFHPIRNWLKTLTWDGVKRLDTWPTVYLGVQASRYAAAVGARWMISAVARVYRPGVNVDHCLVLEGAQGIGKTRTLQILGGKYYTDDVAAFGSKDASMQLLGVWIVELGELESLARVDVDRTKSFLSRPTDHYRPPYARRPIDVPRQNVFAGTINHSSEYLRDDTGGRRFWPLVCRTIDLESLARDRDQLFAEARVRYDAGESWWLDTKELTESARAEQQERLETDPWEVFVEKTLAGKVSEAKENLWQDSTAPAYAEIELSHILSFSLSVPVERQTRAHQMRVARILKRMGWSRERGPKSEDGSRPWVYRKKLTDCLDHSLSGEVGTEIGTK